MKLLMELRAAEGGDHARRLVADQLGIYIAFAGRSRL